MPTKLTYISILSVYTCRLRGRFFGYNVLRISLFLATSKVLFFTETIQSLCNIANDGLLEKSFYESRYTIPSRLFPKKHQAHYIVSSSGRHELTASLKISQTIQIILFDYLTQ